MTADLQKRLIQFAIHTLNLLEADIDWSSATDESISAVANKLNLSTADDDGYFKSLVTESGEDIHVHPFTDEELVTLLEAARMTLGDADLFVGISESLDISDDKLKALQEKLNNHMNS
jgi:hypothetical protein